MTTAPGLRPVDPLSPTWAVGAAAAQARLWSTGGTLDKWFPVWGKLGTYAACDLPAGRARRWSR